ncbi:GxxExxY protein [Chryseobacterium sp. 5_R23647]|uniref:GxxExxY protein n=1 Tax=Chryseobacterium sp. 5_R23647 TaxID=2258964 RepID=UPI000E274AED|nr:GxxExxY protein [Chryseobacterium sp. 5_R23647]REC45197.1 GxxExxY protein [Chryseobacterium sp. 5_R23647]
MTKKEVTQLSYEITGLAIKVHKTLGPGLLESIYEECLKIELIKNGYNVKQQLYTTINYEGVTIETKLIVDLLVNDLIILELKAVEEILPIHEAQLLTYMKILKKPQGLLINFFTNNITKSLKPFINEYFKALPD